jgi:hypothetical protein
LLDLLSAGGSVICSVPRRLDLMAYFLRILLSYSFFVIVLGCFVWAILQISNALKKIAVSLDGIKTALTERD